MRGFQVLKRGMVLTVLFLLAFIICPGVVTYADNDDEIVVDNGLPVVYLNIDETRGTIEDMIASTDHSVFCYGKISIEVPEGFHYVDMPDTACEGVTDLAMSIRGRGNSTWDSYKWIKPP